MANPLYSILHALPPKPCVRFHWTTTRSRLRFAATGPQPCQRRARFARRRNRTLAGGLALCVQPSAPALLAERLRGDAGLLAEKAGKMRRVREGEIVSDFVDRLIGEEELAFRLGQNALANEVRRGDASRTL